MDERIIMKLLFDCDGTLIDSMGIWLSSMKDLIKKSNSEIDNIDSLSYEECIDYIWENLVTDMDENEITSYFDKLLEDGYKNTIPAKDGAIETIKSLNSQGYQMAVATSNSYYLLELVLKRLGIFDCFDDYFTPDTTGFKKGQDEFWTYISNKLNTDMGDLILFDDALYALRSANDAGIKTVGIKDFPYNEDEWDHISKESDFVVDGISSFDTKNLI